MKYLLLLLFFCLPSIGAVAFSSDSTGDKLLLRNIIIQGNNKTRKRIILRELSVHEGQYIAADSLEEMIRINKLRLATTGLFTEITIGIDTLNNDAGMNWIIQLKERWFTLPELNLQLADRNFNVWWKEHNRDLRRTIVGVTLRNKNFRGNLEQIAVTAQAGYTRKLGLEYINPYLDAHQKHGAGFYISFSDSRETFFATDSNKLQFLRSENDVVLRQFEGGLLYVYRPAYASKHIVKLGYRHTTVADSIIRLNEQYFTNESTSLRYVELTYRFELNKTDNWNYPLKGTKLIAQALNRLGAEGMNYQAICSLEAAYFKPLSDKWFTAFTFRGRISLPEDQPYILRTALGTKYDYVRGYEYYVIDGAHFSVLRADLKRELLHISIKNLPFRYLPSVPLRIYPKLFADAGYVWSQFPGNSFLNNRILYSAGAGIDIFTAYDIKIRLEYAWNHLGQKGLFLHFNSE